MRNLYKYVKIYSGAEPVFDEGDVFKLTIPLNEDHLPETVDEGREKSREKGREKSREKIIAALKRSPKITMSELAESIGLSVKGIEKNIKTLREHGIIRRIGPDKGGYWEVIGG